MKLLWLGIPGHLLWAVPLFAGLLVVQPCTARQVLADDEPPIPAEVTATVEDLRSMRASHVAEVAEANDVAASEDVVPPPVVYEDELEQHQNRLQQRASE